MIYISKGSLTTITHIWSFHADAHDFSLHSVFYNANYFKTDLYSRKVFSSNIKYIFATLVWISNITFSRAYFSNYIFWLKDSVNVIPSSHVVWDVVSQSLINSDVGGLS